MIEERKIVLEARDITKSFPGVRALDGVNLSLRSGQLTALLGENGAGKSTLMNILGGALAPDAGILLLDDQEVHFRSPRDAADCGIAIISQELSLVPFLSVAENIFLGREPRNRTGLIDQVRLRTATYEILSRFDLPIHPSTPVGSLGPGQQQVVEIARALSTLPRVLILDEPTSSLSHLEVEVLFNVIGDLKRQGVALVYITHKLEEVARIANCITVMRDGRVVGTAAHGDLQQDEIVSLMAGRKTLETFFKAPSQNGPEVLRAENLCMRRLGSGRTMVLDRVNLRLNRGEVLGLFGLVGAGRTQLLEILFGLHPRTATGEVFIEGIRMNFALPADAIAHGIALAPEDRKREGLFLEMSVLANASSASLDRSVLLGIIDGSRERERLSPYLTRFCVKTSSLSELIRNLSGGNQQKVILAKWIATEPKVLLLDEPTRGIDINAKREIYKFINELAAAGLGIIVVSSELPEVMAVSDRIAVLSEGRKTAEFLRGAADAETILRSALPTHK